MRFVGGGVGHKEYGRLYVGKATVDSDNCEEEDALEYSVSNGMEEEALAKEAEGSEASSTFSEDNNDESDDDSAESIFDFS